MAAQPRKREDIEEHVDWSRVGPDELALFEQLEGASTDDTGKILRELDRRGVLTTPDFAASQAPVDDSISHAAGGGPMDTVQTLFQRFFPKS